MKPMSVSLLSLRRFSIGAVLSLAAFNFTLNSLGADWLQQGGNPQKDNWNRSETAITTANANTLKSLFNFSLPGTPDSAPVYLSNAVTSAGTKDVVFVLSQGVHVLAIDAHTGAQIWRKDYTGTNGSCNSNPSAPAIDPNGQFIYSAGLDGHIHKTKVLDGTEVTGGGWPQLYSGTSARIMSIGFATARDGNTYLYALNSGCNGPSGRIIAINLATGTQNTFTLGAFAWCKVAGAYDADRDVIYTGTQDHGFNPGGHGWGESGVAIPPDCSNSGNPIDSFTPSNQASLSSADLDIAPTSMCILPSVPGSNIPHLGIQSGKPTTLWLVNRDNLSGQGGPGHTGGEITSIAMPQGSGQLGVMGQFAVWQNPADNSVWFFADSDAGISGNKIVVTNGTPSIQNVWHVGHTGVQSPVVANGVVYYTDGGSQTGAAAHVYANNAATGAQLFVAATSGRHWSSPIVVNGVLYCPDGAPSLKAWTPMIGPPNPPNPPTNLAATAVAYNQINLTWTASTSSSVSYNIYRSTISGFAADSSNEVGSSINGTSFSDTTGLSGSTTYYYLAQAVNSGGNSTSSNQASATTPAAPPPPNPPTNAVATAISGTEIDLSWTASTTPGVTYSVYRKESGGGFQPAPQYLIASGITTTSYADTDASKQPNSPYYYDITAVSSAGIESVSANQVSANTLNVIALQASALSPTGGGQTITSTNDAAAPGGTWVKIASTAAGQYIQFTTTSTSIPAGTYQVSFSYRTNPTRGQHHFAIDGTQLDTTPVDQYAPAFGYPPAVTIGSSNVAFPTAASHVIKLTVSGHNAASSNYDVSAVQFIFNQQATGIELVLDPTFTPGPGTYGSAQSVTISTSTPSAAIRYTTDGSTPTSLNGTLYTGPVLIASTTTLKAIAYEAGYRDSNVVSGNYVITGSSVAAPTFTPAAGTYTTAQNVTISTATSGATIRYTMDGSTPSETVGTIYSGPVNISVSTTLKAIAYSGSTDSTVTTGNYTIAPIITLQATSLSPTGSGQTITSTNDTNAPGGTWVKISSTAVGQFIKFTTTTIPAGTYQLSFIYRSNPTRAQHNVQLDSTIMPSVTVDQYASAFGYPPAVNLGTPVTFGSAGTHTIQLNATGKNAASTNFDIAAVQFIFTPQ